MLAGSESSFVADVVPSLDRPPAPQGFTEIAFGLFLLLLAKLGSIDFLRTGVSLAAVPTVCVHVVSSVEVNSKRRQCYLR